LPSTFLKHFSVLFVAPLTLCPGCCSLPHSFAAGAAAFLVKDVQKLQPLLQQQQQQQQQIKRPASASSVNIAQSSATAPLHPHLLRSDSLPTQPEALSRAVPLPKPLALLSAAATAAEIETPWTAADFESAKADIMSLTQASL
jgi:hypothetical protein